MGYDTSFEILHGNKVSMPVSEGAWTSNADYKEGGYFATPIKVGDYVKLAGTADFLVTKCTSGVPIGVVVGAPMGKNETNGRVASIELFCARVTKVTLGAASVAVAVGDSVWADGDKWFKATAANDTKALQAGAANGSIYIMIGAYNVAVDGVDLSTFKEDYDSKINQGVKTTDSPTFAGIVTNGLVDGVDLSAFKADYDAKLASGITTTQTFKDVDGNTKTMTITNGIITNIS